MDEAGGGGGDAFAATGEAEAFGGGSFHGNAVGVDGEVGGDVGNHLGDVGEHLGGLGHDGNVYVANGVAALGKEAHTFAEEEAGVGAAIALVGVGEVVADVAEGGGAEKGIGEGVEGHVGIAVAEQAFFVGDFYAAHYEFTAFHEAVHVEAVANSEVHEL